MPYFLAAVPTHQRSPCRPYGLSGPSPPKAREKLPVRQRLPLILQHRPTASWMMGKNLFPFSTLRHHQAPNASHFAHVMHGCSVFINTGIHHHLFRARSAHCIHFSRYTRKNPALGVEILMPYHTNTRHPAAGENNLGVAMSLLCGHRQPLCHACITCQVFSFPRLTHRLTLPFP